LIFTSLMQAHAVSGADQTPSFEPSQAVEVAPLSVVQHAYLKPKQHLLEQNPYDHIDFTAYALEWGEFKTGLTSIHVGIFPRIQIGTQPLLHLMGIQNASVKYNVVRWGRLDVAATGMVHAANLGEFKGELVAYGAMASFRPTDDWSIHVSGQYGAFGFNGLPTEAPPALRRLVDEDSLAALNTQLSAIGIAPQIQGRGTLVRVASDIRLNRRDSLILQAQSFITGDVQGTLGQHISPIADDFMSLLIPGSSAREFQQTTSGPLSSYVLSLSYQMSFRQLAVRLGGGAGATPLTWIPQANDVSWRFGGKTRARTRRTRRGWRVSGRRDLQDTSPDDNSA
jgi:hypothetical protein